MSGNSGIGLAALAAVVALALAPSPASAAKTLRLTDTLGTVTATVTFQKKRFVGAKRVRLRIVREGQALLDAPVLGEQSGEPASDLPVNLDVVDLDGDGEPEVVLDVYTGGAHCCTVSRIHRLTSAGYALSLRNWGNYGYSLDELDGDGIPELLTLDDRFAYAFASYAASVGPLQVLRYRGGIMEDVTRTFPDLVRKDRDENWRLYQRTRRVGEDVRGILAAWQAANYLLGEEEAGWATLRELRAQGVLRGFKPWPSGVRYLRELRTFLERAGYATTA